MRLSLLILGIAAVHILDTLGYSLCALDRYVVAGRIKDCRSKLPLQGATVFLFLDTYEQVQGPLTREPFDESGVSSADGHFAVTTYFDTLNDPKKAVRIGPSQWADDCSKIATRLELFITKAGYYTTRKEFQKPKVVVRGMREKSIELPEFCIEPRAQ